MKQGMIMVIVVLAISLALAVALFGTPLLPIALVAGVLITVSGIFVVFFHPEETALFLFGQPLIFLSWYASPLLAAVFESLITFAFLVSAGYSGVRRGVVSAIFLVSVSWLVALFISTQRHVFLPLFLLLVVCVIVTLTILGIASHLIHRVAGGLHEAPGR